MQNQNEETNSSKNKKTTQTVRVASKTSRILNRVKRKIDNKVIGRNISKDRIIFHAISRVANDKEFLKELRNETISESDLLKQDHRDYCKRFGKISMEKYLGKLRRGELFELSKKEDSITKNQSFTTTSPPIFDSEKLA